jgi:hypothetical protein
MDVWIFNGTNKTLDLAMSLHDVTMARGALVPPGAQGHFSAEKADIDATIAHLTRYGAAEVQEGQRDKIGISTVGPLRLGAAVPTVIEVPPPRQLPKQPKTK